MAEELSGEIAELADRLRSRRLYKCFDVAEKLGGKPPGNIRLRFKKALRDAGDISYLEDDYALSPYKIYDFDSPSALSKVLVKEHESDAQPTGIENLSPIIKALTEREQIYRLASVSDVVLELAATMVFLQKNGYAKDFVEEVRERKPLKATEDRLDRAQKLIKKLGL